MQALAKRSRLSWRRGSLRRVLALAFALALALDTGIALDIALDIALALVLAFAEQTMATSCGFLLGGLEIWRVAWECWWDDYFLRVGRGSHEGELGRIKGRRVLVGGVAMAFLQKLAEWHGF
jgi:hypothetical protein